MIFINIYFVPDRKKMKIKVKFLTDRQANRQTDRQVDRQTDRQTDRQLERDIDKNKQTQTDEHKRHA